MTQNEENVPDIFELMRQSSAATRVEQPPAGHKARGLWKTLEAFAESHPPAAVMAAWRHHTGAEFGTMETFLRPTSRLAQLYPCLAEAGCGDPHEVVSIDDDRWIARSQEDMRYCPGIRLAAPDLVLHELDTERLGGELCRVLGFEPAADSSASDAAPKLWPVGTYPETGSPVYLALCLNEGQLLRNLQGLMSVCGEPFILLAPTARSRSEVVTAMLHRERCAFIPLASSLAPDGAAFRLTNSIQPILDRFAAGCVPRVRAGQANSESRTQSAEIESVGPRYSLRKGLGTWELVFAGRKGFVEDERGTQIVAYLLRNPPVEPIHAVPLETKVWAREWAESSLPGRESQPTDEANGAEHPAGEFEMGEQASGARLDQGENTLLKKKFRELLEIIEDTTLPQDERDAAQLELDELHRALDGAAGRAVVDDAAKAAERVRKAIKRLQAKLANAIDANREANVVLRDFADHLLTHLLVPSSRFNRGKGSRNRAGVAGTFTYEPPAGVVWER